MPCPRPAGEPERLVRRSELTEAVALLNEGTFPHSFLRLELLRLATRRFDPVAHARIEAECRSAAERRVREPSMLIAPPLTVRPMPHFRTPFKPKTPCSRLRGR